MYSKSILPEKYATFDYYRKRLPQYLQQSSNFLSHFELWYDLLTGKSEERLNGIAPTLDAILFMLNIFDPNYMRYIADLGDYGQGEDQYGTISALLDQIGSIYGVSRNYPFSVTGSTDPIQLNNYDYWQVIKTQIVRNNFDGTSEMVHQFYKDSGLKIQQLMTTTPGEATVILISSESEYPVSNNIETLFLNGYLTLESLGIKYARTVYATSSFFTFDSTDTNKQWNSGVWQ